MAEPKAVDKPEDATTVEQLVPFAQDEEHARLVAQLSADKDVKLPADLSKVSDAKAKELVEAGLVEDADLPGKMYRRKADGFTTRIPDYIFNAYSDYHKDEWEEIKLTSDAPESAEEKPPTPPPPPPPPPPPLPPPPAE